MSEPTREIKIARQLLENMMSEYADDIKEYHANLERLRQLTGRPTPAPQEETPEQNAALERVLKEVRKRNAIRN